MDAELSRELRAIAMRMGNYRFAQGQARERGEHDKADEYANEADKAWRELFAATKPDGVKVVPAVSVPRDLLQVARDNLRVLAMHGAGVPALVERLDAALAAGVGVVHAPKQADAIRAGAMLAWNTLDAVAQKLDERVQNDIREFLMRAWHHNNVLPALDAAAPKNGVKEDQRG